MSKIGSNVSFSEDTVLGQGVTVGNNVTFYPGVTVGDDVTIWDGAIIGRPPKATATITHTVTSESRPLTIGSGSIIGANAVLYTGITIGSQVLIGDLASIREECSFQDSTVIGRGVLVMYHTSVGRKVRVIDGAILTGNMVIEDDVFIGPGVNTVNDNDVYLKRFGLQPFSVRGPVVRRFALIGTGANLAAGIEIGLGAIVAPSAMVTRDVPPWMVVAGVPAKPLREVDLDQRRQILEHFNISESML